MATSRVNVKIPTQRLIDALTEAKTKHEKIVTDYKEKVEKAKESEKARQKAAYDYASDPKNIESASREMYQLSSGTTVRIEVKVPKSALPKTIEVTGQERHEAQEASEAIKAIENSIRILKLTDDEHVSTSTYNSVARYL